MIHMVIKDFDQSIGAGLAFARSIQVYMGARQENVAFRKLGFLCFL